MDAKFINKEVEIPVSSIKLEGSLSFTLTSKKLIIFAHGSGSSRHSPRNNFVSQILRSHDFGTLLFDLLTKEEDENYANRFDIKLLVDRLKTATDWVIAKKELKDFKLGYFGASTGSAAALIAASDLGNKISAVVSRGGRPDLAIKSLAKLRSPTLLVVGGNDFEVIELNKLAYDQIGAKKKIEIIPGAMHLFEEPGTLEKVAELAVDWFNKYI